MVIKFKKGEIIMKIDKSELQSLNNKKLSVSAEPPYDHLQAFVRENHIALEGKSEGPLSEYVFAAKDVFKIKGSTMGNGHPDYLKYSQPDEMTATTVTRLLESGADLVGKTVCDELCFSISGENYHYGSPINPYDIRRLSGGSSSGTCVATAAGFVDFAIGSDCLGSVRVPASYNGLFALRPTYKRVDNEGEAAYCESMDVLGFVAKESNVFSNVAKVLLGKDKNPTKFTKLIIPDDLLSTVNEDVREALKDAIEEIKNKVDKVEHVDLSQGQLDEWVRTFQLVQGYEVWQSYGGFIRKYKPFVSPGPQSRLDFASTITMQQYEDAKIKKEEITKRVNEVISSDAVLVMPTASSVAPLKTTPEEDIKVYRAQSSKLLCVSPLTGVPSLQLPLAVQDNVPLGVTLLAQHDTDQALVEFGLSIFDK